VAKKTRQDRSDPVARSPQAQSSAVVPLKARSHLVQTSTVRRHLRRCVDERLDVTREGSRLVVSSRYHTPDVLRDEIARAMRREKGVFECIGFAT
jgi:hypothetical protein